jgi:hypothetical protein
MSNPTKPTEMGPNRTGIGTSPIDGKAVVEGAQRGSPAAIFAPPGLSAARLRHATRVAPVGIKPAVFLDLLGERLAFERTGTRLYEALLVKQAAADPHPGGPTRADLEEIRDDELEHFGLIRQAIEALGADPTAITPGADVIGVASHGLVEAVSDPRVTLTESLKAVLAAELIDNDSWLTLVEVAEGLGQEVLAQEFRHSLAVEEGHLARVRIWLSSAIQDEAGIDVEEGNVESLSPSAP